MTGTLQPLDQKFAIVDERGMPTEYFIRWAQQKQIDIGDSITLTDLQAFLTAHKLVPGVGIQFAPDGDINNSPIIHADVQAILDEITATRGAVLYRGLLGWAALLPGTAGQFLQSAGAGADPVWAAAGGGGSGLTLLEQHTAAASATLDFTTGISATYDEYLFEFVNLRPATSGAIPWLRMSTDGGVTYDSGTNYSDYFHARDRGSFYGNGSEVDTKLQISNNGQITIQPVGMTGYFRLFSPGDTTLWKSVLGELTINGNGGGFPQNCQFSGWYRSLLAVNAIRFLFSAGNITSGTIRMYGVAK